jgi:2-polyprenyl-3-methyl-5-hydroxy-6-metoxy-1,4-benzoquinol methylase
LIALIFSDILRRLVVKYILMNANGWGKFWESQKTSFDDVMKISTAFFATQFTKTFHVSPGNTILDYGCGPGFLEDCLKTKQVSITGADINDFFIEQCKINHPGATFIKITTNIEVNRKILEEELKGKTFDFVILLSITQYLKDVAELESIIRMLYTYTSANGRIIIADVVDPKTSSIKDALALLFYCIKKGKVKAYTMFMLHLLFSNYRTTSMDNKLLQISPEVLCQIAKKNFLECNSIEGLTPHPTRANYILTKKTN